VWLISVSCFRRSDGRGEFGHIELVGGDEVMRMLTAPELASG
jgi:hypothetical protein